MKSELSLIQIRKNNFFKYSNLNLEKDPYKITSYSNYHCNTLITNPYSKDNDIVSLYAITNNIVVGRLDFFHDELNLKEKKRVVWLSNLTVPEEYRNRFVGVYLLNKAVMLYPTVASFGVARIALKTYRGLNWQERTFPEFWKVLSLENIINFKVKRKKLRNLTKIVNNFIALFCWKFRNFRYQ